MDQLSLMPEPSQSTPLPPPARNLLTLVTSTGRFWFSPPEGPTTRLEVTEESELYPLEACATAVGLTTGYWRRDPRPADSRVQTWTWVAL